MNIFKRKHNTDSSQALSKELLQKASRIGDVYKINKKAITYMLVLVNGESVDELSMLVTQAVIAIQKTNASIYSLTGPLILLAFGPLKFESINELDACNTLARELEIQLGHKVSGIYGQAMGGFGNLGDGMSLALLSFVLPGFDCIIKQLADVPKGEIKKIQPN